MKFESVSEKRVINFLHEGKGLKLIICFTVEEMVNIIIIFSEGKGLKLTLFSSTGGKCYRVKTRAYRAAKGGERACNAYRQRNPTCY